MVSGKMKCGHPIDWAVIKLPYGGKRYTYCAGCLIEKIGIKNMEAYENPLIHYKDSVKEVEDKKVVEKTSKK